MKLYLAVAPAATNFPNKCTHMVAGSNAFKALKQKHK